MNTMSDSVLKVEAIRASYGKKEVLPGVSLDLRPGEVVALLGDNGTGKSTLLRVIAGILTPSAGRVILEGRVVTGLGAKQRHELAVQSELSEAQILKFANMVDLYRVKGVGSEFAELLEAAGVDTVPELAQRNVTNLTKAMSTVNEAKNLTRRVPTETEVSKWVEEAKTLPRVIEY